MNDTAKLSLSVMAGMALGKMTAKSGSYWWLLGAAGALFIFNSPAAQSTIKTGAQSVYSRIKK